MKYRLTNQTCMCCGHILHRIECVTAFGENEEGHLGGYIESENNLSQEGTCWVDGNAHVFGNARVEGNAQVLGNSHIYDDAVICGDAVVKDDAWVYGKAVIGAKAQVIDNTSVYGSSHIGGTAIVVGNSKVCDMIASEVVVDTHNSEWYREAIVKAEDAKFFQDA